MTQQSHSWAYIQRQTWFKWIHAPQSLFKLAKTWKQTKCPLTDEGLRRCGTHTQWNTTGPLKKKIKIMSFAAIWTDLETIILRSQKDKYQRNTKGYHLCVESKIWHKWTYLWNKNRLTGIENRLVAAKKRGVEEGRAGSLRLVKANTGWINNKVLLYNTGNYIQYPTINHNGKFLNIIMYNWVTLLYSKN